MPPLIACRGGDRPMPDAIGRPAVRRYGSPWTFGDDVLAAIGGTPLIRLRRASEIAGGATILGKAEFMNPGRVGQGPRGARHRARCTWLAAGCGQGGAIVEGTAGNTGIGLALVGNALGFRTVIVIPQTQSPGEEGHAAPHGRRARRGAGRALRQSRTIT